MSMIINSYRFGGASGGGGGGGIDPYFSNVVLLLHFDGVNGGTIFTDSSASAHAWTAIGNAQTSTAQYKFGTASGYFDGSASIIKSPFSADWDFSNVDWTVEMWVYPTTVSGLVSFFDHRDSNAASVTLVRNGTSLDFYTSFDDVNWAATPAISAPGAFAVNTWVHVAVTRQGSDYKVWVNGVQGGATWVNSGTYISSLKELRFGGIAGYYFSGHIDDARITKGVARDVSVIPAGPYPDS